jgi:hypothetical protein
MQGCAASIIRLGSKAESEEIERLQKSAVSLAAVVDRRAVPAIALAVSATMSANIRCLNDVNALGYPRHRRWT